MSGYALSSFLQTVVLIYSAYESLKLAIVIDVVRTDMCIMQPYQVLWFTIVIDKEMPSLPVITELSVFFLHYLFVAHFCQTAALD